MHTANQNQGVPSEYLLSGYLCLEQFNHLG